MRKRNNLLTGEGEWGGRGAESYKKAWSSWPSINNSVLYAYVHAPITVLTRGKYVETEGGGDGMER
jgi:hypothetical protein